MPKAKAAKTDYSANMLPQTRKAVFWDVLKLHWKSFLSYGFLCLLFTLPFHAVAIYGDFFQANLMYGFENMSTEQQQQVILQVLSMNNTQALANVVSFLILAICLAGLTRVIRQYAWGENVFFSHEFGKGIKQNAKQMLSLALLVGVLYALTMYAGNLASVTTNKVFAVVLAIPVCVAIVVGVPTMAYAVVSISIYQHTFWGHVKLGAVMAGKTPLKTFLAVVCCFVPFVLQVVPNIYCHIIGRVVGSLLVPVVLFGWYLFALNTFDKHVNKIKFPNLVGKGTFAYVQRQIDNANKSTQTTIVNQTEELNDSTDATACEQPVTAEQSQSDAQNPSDK